jgi:small GTP-binding protein
MSEPQKDENGYDIIPCKIVLVGQSGVGKTNIITKYVNNEFSEETESTNGASFASKEISYENLKKTLKMEIWDTAGQEKFRSLTRFFYKDAAIAILVYDITRKDSFDELKDYWYSQISQFAGKNISKNNIYISYIIILFF